MADVEKPTCSDEEVGLQDGGEKNPDGKTVPTEASAITQIAGQTGFSKLLNTIFRPGEMAATDAPTDSDIEKRRALRVRLIDSLFFAPSEISEQFGDRFAVDRNQIDYFIENGSILILEEIASQAKGDATPLQDYHVTLLLRGCDFYGDNLGKFHEFQAAIAPFLTDEIKIISAWLCLQLPPHHNEIALFQECVETLSELFRKDDSPASLAILYSQGVYGGDMNKFRACARYFKEGTSEHVVGSPLTPPDIEQLDEFVDGPKHDPSVGEGMERLYRLTDSNPGKLRRLKEIILKTCRFKDGALDNRYSVRNFTEMLCTPSHLGEHGLAETAQTIDLDFLEVCAEGFVDSGADVVIPLLKAKKLCGDDKEMFERFASVPKKKSPNFRSVAGMVSRLVEASTFYQDDKNKFKIIADCVYAGASWSKPQYLTELLADCGDDIELFKTVLDAETIQYSRTSRTILALKQLHKNDIERYKRAVAITDSSASMLGWNESSSSKVNNFIAANSDVIGDNMEHLQAMCDIVTVEFGQTNNGYSRCKDIPYYALKGAGEAFVLGKDILSAAPHLTLVCGKIAILYGDEGIHALRRLYERNPQEGAYELFVGVTPSESQEAIQKLASEFPDKNGKDCLEALAMAASIYQQPEIARTRFHEHSSSYEGEGRSKFTQYVNSNILSICDRAHGDCALVTSCVEGLRWGGNGDALDKYINLYRAFDSQEEKNLVMEGFRSLLWNWNAITWERILLYIKTLGAANDKFGNDREKFRIFTDVLKAGRKTGDMLLAAQEIYGDDMRKFQVFVDATRNGDDHLCKVLAACRGLYKDDYDRLCEVRNMLRESLEPLGKFTERNRSEWNNRTENSYCYVCDLLSATNEIYGENEGIFLQVKELVLGLVQDGFDNAKLELMQLFIAQARSFGGSIEIFQEYMKMGRVSGGAALCKQLASTSEAYGRNLEMLREFRNIMEEHGKAVAGCLYASREVYQQDFACFLEVQKEIVEIKKEAGDEACSALGDTMSNYYKNPPLALFKFFAVILREDGVDMCLNLRNTKDVCGADVKKLQIARQFFGMNFDYHPAVLQGYIRISQTQGEARAGEYLEDLREKAKQLICHGIPEKVRSMPEYPFLITCVFPEGHYSNYEKNARCGDRLEHVEKYCFPCDGYPVKLSGLTGYKIKDGQNVDPAVLEAYSQRLDRVRAFISSRGPDNIELQKAFDEKVNALFAKYCHPAFSRIEALTTKEKMILLFLSEVIRKASDPKHFQSNGEILDLVVEYKYAYEENLEAYIQYSSDVARTHRDETSQHYMLLNELSTIYGENLKHVLQHNIFGELETCERWPQIQAAYASLFHLEVGADDLKEKHWERIQNTFENPRIPDERRFSLLCEQMQGLFGSNIEFGQDGEKGEFQTKLHAILAPLQEDFSLKKFRSMVTSLFALRREYRFRINKKLTELFSHDIDAISREIAKYEPVVEMEEKERPQGVPENKFSKKSPKERNIRGYITKTRETANARMGAHLCIAGDEGMWLNEDYFELVLKDEHTGKCVGMVMLLNIQATNGKRYLWFGPNPFEGLLEQVSSKRCYDYLYRTVTTFAEENNFDGVVIPSDEGSIHGMCTNRGGNFPDLIKQSRLKDSKGKFKIADFGGSHELASYNNHHYLHKDGALIWERKAT